MSTREEIRLLGLGLEVGESLTGQLCPFCARDDDKQFSVTRSEAGLLYICFRATCGKSGLIGSAGNFSSSDKSNKSFTARPYLHPTGKLNDYHKEFFYTRWGITEEELNENRFVYNPERDTFVYPIFDSGGDQVGVVDRAYNGRKPKAITYFEKEREKLHFPRTEHKGDTVVVVEDHLSAIKVARYAPSVALLGCVWGNKEQRLLSYMFRKVILALDPGTEVEAIRMKRRYSLDYERFDIRILEKDPKDMTDEEIRRLIIGEEDTRSASI